MLKKFILDGESARHSTSPTESSLIAPFGNDDLARMHVETLAEEEAGDVLSVFSFLATAMLKGTFQYLCICGDEFLMFSD